MSTTVQMKLGSRYLVTVEAEDPKGAFEELAELAKILGPSKCGACGGAEIVPQVTHPQTYTYYSLRCNGCGAELKFGQRKEDQALFPKLKDEDGNWLPHRGWQKWNGGQDEPRQADYRTEAPDRRDFPPPEQDDLAKEKCRSFIDDFRRCKDQGEFLATQKSMNENGWYWSRFTPQQQDEITKVMATEAQRLGLRSRTAGK